jgi:hypothetical protein
MGLKVIGGQELATVIFDVTTVAAGATAWFSVPYQSFLNLWLTGNFTNAVCELQSSTDGGATPARPAKDSALNALIVDSTIGSVCVPLYESEAGVLYRVNRTGAGTGSIKIQVKQ